MWFRMRLWLFHAATGAPRVVGLRLADPGVFVRSFGTDFRLSQPWWALARRDLDRDLIAFWWSPLWWYLHMTRARAALFWRPLVRSGLWRVEPCGLYSEGRLQWPDMWSRMRR